MPPIAHIRKADRAQQPLRIHLHAVAALCGHFACAARLKTCGVLIGLLHDLGKFSAAFQLYICSKQEEAEALEVDAAEESRRVNHSAAGAQRLYELWAELFPNNRSPSLLPLLASPMLSHHNPSGLVDFVSADGTQEPFAKRLSRDHDHTFLPEIRSCLLVSPRSLRKALLEISRLSADIGKDPLQHLLVSKFLYSCLIDADRTDSADFEHPSARRLRSLRKIPDWSKLLQRFETVYSERYGKDYHGSDPIILTRRAISDACRAAGSMATSSGSAGRAVGQVLSLPVPTGGGKTLASLRFALAHAVARGVSDVPIRHIIYVLPFTTILIQNAEEARMFVGAENVLEHHANLLPSQIDRRQILLSENWDAPVILTTTVQFLNAFYSDSKEAQRRMHQAASSIIIFDEAQALPIKTLHLFSHAVNFLTRHTAATAVICTATPPLLDKINPTHGCVTFTSNPNLAADVDMSPLLTRTELLDKRKLDGSSVSILELIAMLATPLVERKHTLVIVNTKKQAADVFDAALAAFPETAVTHLSDNQCPAHLRGEMEGFRLDERRSDKSSPTLLCVSTSLVEAGVDLDFDLVVRDIAGFVSIVQAAGRCNRHGRRRSGECWVVNLEREGDRPGLREEIEATERVLRERQPRTPAEFAEACALYFRYFYHEKKEQMLYPANGTTLLDLLTCNKRAVEEAMRRNGRLHDNTTVPAAPESAARLFEVIDSATRGVIVPHTEEGKQIIKDFCSADRTPDGAIANASKLLARARPYTVNLYKDDWEALHAARHEVQEGTGVFYLDDRHYHPDKGVTLEETVPMPYLHDGQQERLLRLRARDQPRWAAGGG